MTKQLTPAEELRCYYKAATILAEMLAAQSYGDCPPVTSRLGAVSHMATFRSRPSSYP